MGGELYGTLCRLQRSAVDEVCVVKCEVDQIPATAARHSHSVTPKLLDQTRMGLPAGGAVRRSFDLSYQASPSFSVRKTARSDWKLDAGGSGWHESTCDECGKSFFIVEK